MLQTAWNVIKVILVIICVLVLIYYVRSCDPIKQSVSNCENANEYLIEEHNRMTEELNQCREFIEDLQE